MSVTKKLLVDCVLKPCGHNFQCWTETLEDGTWELHFHAPCEVGERIAEAIRNREFPGKRIIKAT